MSSELDRGIAIRSNDESDWVRVVASLIKRTEQGTLRWKSGQAPQSLQEQLVDVVFTAEYEGKRLRLYKEPRRVEAGGHVALPTRYPLWVEEVVLEVGDQLEQGWYAIPKTGAANQLLESVEYQVYGVDDFISKILGSDSSQNKASRN